MAIIAFTKSVVPDVKMSGVIYSLPINATPDNEAALDISMMQLIAKAIEG